MAVMKYQLQKTTEVFTQFIVAIIFVVNNAHADYLDTCSSVTSLFF